MKRIYSIWIFFLFAFTFFLLFPIYYVFLQNQKWHRPAHELTKFWARVIFYGAGIRVEKIFEGDIENGSPYIYAPNHFSYFDIPLIAFSTPGFYKFMGKKSLGEIPVFGYMFSRLYITVNRESRIDSYRALHRGLEELEKNIGLVVYPEGGIRDTAPNLSRFKDGPFRMAVRTGVPLVPVTIPFNWIFLPDEQWVVNPRKLKIIFHKPIETKHLTEDDMEDLKKQTFDIISKRLKEELESENR
jgi:1-acyl-sn-glycerol-3-phosphate acyltransferase